MITLLSLSVVVSGLTETSTGLLVYADEGIVILVLATWFKFNSKPQSKLERPKEFGLSLITPHSARAF